MPRGRRKAVRYTAADTDPQMSLMPEHDWDFVDTAVERVLHAWDAHHMMKPDAPMLLAFSGGKDSVCLYHICRKASEKAGIPFEEMFHAQYNITNLDPPELVRFVRENYPEVHMHHPEKTIWKLIVEKHMPPMRNTRYCCKELKEISQIKGGFSLTGVRHAESPKRALRGGMRLSDTSSRTGFCSMTMTAGGSSSTARSSRRTHAIRSLTGLTRTYGASYGTRAFLTAASMMRDGTGSDASAALSPLTRRGNAHSRGGPDTRDSM